VIAPPRHFAQLWLALQVFFPFPAFVQRPTVSAGRSSVQRFANPTGSLYNVGARVDMRQFLASLLPVTSFKPCGLPPVARLRGRGPFTFPRVFLAGLTQTGADAPSRRALCLFASRLFLHPQRLDLESFGGCGPWLRSRGSISFGYFRRRSMEFRLRCVVRGLLGSSCPPAHGPYSSPPVRRNGSTACWSFRRTRFEPGCL